VDAGVRADQNNECCHACVENLVSV